MKRAPAIVATLASDIAATAKAVPVLSGEGALFPQNQEFSVVIEDEVLHCTSITDNTLAVTRGKKAAAHSAGELVLLFVDDRHVQKLNEYVDTLATDAELAAHAALDTGVHGAGGDTLATDADIATHAAAGDPHTGYILHSLATAVSDFLVASGAGVFVKKTLAEVKTLIDIAIQHCVDVTLTGPATGDVLQYNDPAGKWQDKQISELDAFKDEDDMASDSATAICSQQSIKKYVDDNAGGGAWTVSTTSVTSVSHGMADNTYKDWDLSAVTGGRYFLGLFAMQKKTAADSIGLRTNGAIEFPADARYWSNSGGLGYGAITSEYYSSTYPPEIDNFLICWCMSDANSIVEIKSDDVSDADIYQLVAWMPISGAAIGW